mmetsp:Transcript_30557/g.64404  ORF Transcript_30557/g.64404 Transcript_30557/m.64404 type:complete len:153 (-) Transcript_30557:167-625(-)|eukprot:CAMPEP_0171339978 /NCGR_PEP_ID=MMETSP0878-20121228/8274_1 /TAXON_ID=67004 /ORGANISM="Thalassiosira weissflogii, Strain CCMP1336" /LENGTH=152 /DNA_ID=CAMNT_0011841969 /DNA_START=133 /DNA_END=591 /DNA_ORIENTATION=-
MSSEVDTNTHFSPTVQLTEAAAETAVRAAQEVAAKNNWKVTIAITDAGGSPLLVKRCDGAFPASFDIALGKAKTACHFYKCTGQLEDAVNVAGGSSRTALLSSSFILMRGGVPIFIDGFCVGAVGVSGVKPDEDEKIALVAVDAVNSIPSRL